MPPFDRPATYEDLSKLPGDLVAEIVDGELHATSSRAPGGARGAMALGGTLLRGLGRSGSDWQILPGPELHLGSDVLVPPLAGWRRSRLPQLPATAYFSVAPDWLCDLTSGTASLRAKKMAIYASEGVAHMWLIDPVARTLEVRRQEDGRWKATATYVGEQIVRAEPFEALELDLATLWPGR
jgi:Uma2 family endonuclease